MNLWRPITFKLPQYPFNALCLGYCEQCRIRHAWVSFSVVFWFRFLWYILRVVHLGQTVGFCNFKQSVFTSTVAGPVHSPVSIYSFLIFLILSIFVTICFLYDSHSASGERGSQSCFNLLFHDTRDAGHFPDSLGCWAFLLIIVSHLLLLFSFFFFLWCSAWNQGLVHTRHMLYQWECTMHPNHPVYFLRIILL